MGGCLSLVVECVFELVIGLVRIKDRRVCQSAWQWQQKLSYTNLFPFTSSKGIFCVSCAVLKMLLSTHVFELYISVFLVLIEKTL